LTIFGIDDIIEMLTENIDIFSQNA